MLNIRENALHLIMPYVTVNLLSRVFCLGQNGKICGTGFAVEIDGEQYLVTANHVAKASQYKPQILMEGWDSTFNWKTIGKDEDNDVAVLAADRQLCPPTEIQIETGKITFGQTGYALGFPMDYGTDIFGRLEPEGDAPSYPMPMAAPTTFYGGGNPRYYWGSVAIGFSGGPVVFPTWPDPSRPTTPLSSGNWAITGVVIGYAKRQFEIDKDGALWPEVNLSYEQPVGMVKVADKSVFMELIRAC
ncbi:MAG: serine protease [Chloroflexota bacterium]|nr:serine protease [Chloroflexota bacterium]MDE2684338.1 serine protease [Chloroflexota bacterium]